MENNIEARMYLLGRECELGKVSAMQLIDAKTKGRTYMSDWDISDDNTELVLAAFIAAESVKYDGKYLFTDGEDVLFNLSAQEIMEIAMLYNYEPVNSQNRAEEKRVSADELMSADTKKTASVWRVVDDNTKFVSDFQNPARPGGEVKIQTPGSNRFFGANAEMRRYASPREEYENLSYFYERDSRRFDSEIERY